MNVGSWKFPLLLLALASAHAADWSTYRSDNHRSGFIKESVSYPLQLTWTRRAEHSPVPAWPLPARRSYWQRLDYIEPRVADDWTYPPIAAGDAVYFGSSADDHVYCLEAATGQLRWSFCTDGPIRYAPTVAQGRVYFGSDDGCAYCLEAATGRQVWKRRLAPEDRRIPGNGRLISPWPLRTGVLVDDGVVYALAGLYPQQGVYAFALNATNGEVAWKTTADFSPEGYLLASDKMLFVPTGRSNPVALDRANGKVLRRFDGVGGTYTLVTDSELVAGRGNSGELAVSDLSSNERLANFEGRHMAVTPKYSYLLSDTNLIALDRARYLDLTRQITKLSQQLAAQKRRADPETRQLSERMARLKEELPRCKLWETPVEHGLSLAAAENVVVIGGRDVVTFLSASTGQHVWSAPLEGGVLGLALAADRLIVSTEGGDLLCFSTSTSAPKLHEPPIIQAPPTAHADELVRAAVAILQATPTQRGFCLVLGAGSGRLAYEIASRSELHVAIVDSNAEEIDRVRAILTKAGVYGTRVTAYTADSTLPFTDFVANLIVSESAWTSQGKLDWSRSEIERVLRPFGGTLWLAKEDQPYRRGPLEGAGQWTHQFGNPGNTSSSGDRLIRTDLQLQWFGGPGPRPMVDRHLRAPAPLSAEGRLFIPAENALIAVDAYNGTELWHIELPGSQRYSMPYDAGYLSLDGGRLAVAVRDACWIIDAATGKKLRAVPLPPGAGADRHWGYVALQKNKLFGTVQKASASRTSPTYEQIDVDYSNEQPLVTGERIFCVDLDKDSLEWQRRGGALLNPTLTLSGDRFFCVESRAITDHPTGRISLKDLNYLHLIALDARHGSTVWDRPLGEGMDACRNILYLACNGEALVATGSLLGTNQDTLYRLACYDSSTGEPRWRAEHDKGLTGAFAHGEQVHHPVLLGNFVVAEPVVYDLKSGQRLARSTDGTDWRLIRPGHSCGTLSGAGDCLFFRANNPTVMDLPGDLAGQKQPVKLSPSRAGCWINIIPASGLVLIPEASAGCVCHYSLQTSMAFLPR